MPASSSIVLPVTFSFQVCCKAGFWKIYCYILCSSQVEYICNDLSYTVYQWQVITLKKFSCTIFTGTCPSGTAITRIVPTWFNKNVRITEFEAKFGEYDTPCEFRANATEIHHPVGLKGYTVYCGNFAGSDPVFQPNISCLKAEAFYCKRKSAQSRSTSRARSASQLKRTKDFYTANIIEQKTFHQRPSRNYGTYDWCPAKEKQKIDYSLVLSHTNSRIDRGTVDQEITENSCLESEADGIECKRGYAFCGLQSSMYSF
jgi:hypothetical protein